MKQIDLKLIIIGIVSLFIISGFNSLSAKENEVKNKDDILFDNLDYWAVIAAPAGGFDKNALYLKELLVSEGWREDHIKFFSRKSATSNNVLNAIDWIASNDDSDDTTLIFLNDHGAPGCIMLYNSLLTYSDLNAHVNNLDSEGIGIIINACYSGSAIPKLAAPGRVIVTGCRANETGTDISVHEINNLVGFADQTDGIGNKNGVVSLEESYNYLMNNWHNNWYIPQMQDDYSGELELIFYEQNNEKMDQYPEPKGESNTDYYKIDSDCYRFAQSFRPSHENLTKVRLFMSPEGTTNFSFTISIRDDLYGTDLTSVTVPPEYFQNYKGFRVFDFPDIQVDVGDVYYIVCKISNKPNIVQYTIYGKVGDNYNNGKTFRLTSDGQNWEVINHLDFLFVTYGNGADNMVPLEPSSPSPANEEIDLDINNVLLKWSGGDPEGDAVFYDIYLSQDTNFDDDPIIQNQTNTYFDLGILEYDTIYFWKIVAKDIYGLVTEGPTWSFTTKLSLNEVLDQEQNETIAIMAFNSGFTAAQSFKPSLDVLSKIKFLMKKGMMEYSDLINVSIRQTIAGEDLVKVSIDKDEISIYDRWITFDIPDIQVNVNETYFIIVEGSSYYNNQLEIYILSSGTNSYLEGSSWLYISQSDHWLKMADWDFCFKTYGLNNPPVKPTNPSPFDCEILYNTTSVNLAVDVFDSDGDSMIVMFYNANDGSQIGFTQTDVPSCGTATTPWDDLSIGSTYSWYAVANDGYVTIQSEIWSFTIENIPPNAGFKFSPIQPNIDEVVQFIDNSTDIDGNIDSWYWDFGDGTNSNEQNPTHEYTESGIYQVTLKVTDDCGDTANVGKLVLVEVETTPVTNLFIDWNFISLPFNETVDKTDFVVKYDGYFYSWDQATTDNNPTDNPLINSYIFGWDGDSQSYVFADTLESGQGYWMYASCDCELISVNVDEDNNYNLITDVKQNWNIIGVPFNFPVDKNDILVNYEGTNYAWSDAVALEIINDYVFGWNPKIQSYDYTNTFEPGHAYWLYAYEDCTLLYSDTAFKGFMREPLRSTRLRPPSSP